MSDVVVQNSDHEKIMQQLLLRGKLSHKLPASDANVGATRGATHIEAPATTMQCPLCNLTFLPSLPHEILLLPDLCHMPMSFF